MNKPAKFILSIFLSAIFAIIAMIIIYWVAVTVSPPYFLDERTGEKYMVMPIGQMMISVIAAIVIFVLSFILFYFKYIRTKK